MKFYVKHSFLIASIFLSNISTAKDIYVAKNGNDDSLGTQTQPYLTLTKAANTAVAGDTVYIRTGTYEETLAPVNSGTESSPIVFQSYENEKVVITAMEALSGFQQDKGDIYVTNVAWDLGQKNFVMQNRTAMDLARWPNNIDDDPFTQNSLRNTGGSPASEAFNAYLDYSAGIPEADWSKGGSIYFYGDKPGSGWTTWRAFITGNTTTRVNFELNKSPAWIRTFHAPADKGDFFLQGVKEVLDYQNEWFFDAENHKLYVQLPEGKAPENGQIKMRKRDLTVNLSGKHYIHIKNLAVFGGSIALDNNASNNKLYGITSLYGNYTLGVVSGFSSGSQSVYINGDNNVIEKSEIGFGSGSGIWDAGTNTKIINSYLHDFNYLGNYDSIISARGGSALQVLQNTITRGGRDAIQSVKSDSEFAYNDVSFSNLIADDCALFYTVGGPSNSVIHHNWFHDAYSSGSKKKAAGIYLDNDSQAYSVHHNVVWNTEWSSIQINWNGVDLDIYNNTLWDGDVVMGAWHKEGTAFSNVKVWNNLANDNNWEPQSDKQNNIATNTDPFIDSANGDFRLKESSAPIDMGRQIDNITTDVTDSKPDVGAYERGGNDANWVAGIDWEKKYGPTGNGCYGLPGEFCEEVPSVNPIVSIISDQNADEGSTVSVTVSLSSLALNYPVTIPYTISGTSTSFDHDAENGEIVINTGTTGSLSIAILADNVTDETNESLIVTLETPTNATLAAINSHTITLVDKTPSVPVALPTKPEEEQKNTASSGGSMPIYFITLLIAVLGLRRKLS
ncbi:right-handed parallel beta-helix repeat-containing protein [Colwellia sp. UCD-KL20]|uniref:right-handed parallel beta-helix repeat-containing protein n=1 Tax=Colwellia sp. UCD-KL20 TaxID=1917165 RepID=UPI0009714336|nr:right-handed parallel beta-helix repeat-containing protein [Colwellia sp. UCD-KL20]